MAKSKLTYSIVFVRSARKELESLDQIRALRILKKIEGLPLDPRPTGCKKLTGQTLSGESTLEITVSFMRLMMCNVLLTLQ